MDIYTQSKFMCIEDFKRPPNPPGYGPAMLEKAKGPQEPTLISIKLMKLTHKIIIIVNII